MSVYDEYGRPISIFWCDVYGNDVCSPISIFSHGVYGIHACVPICTYGCDVCSVFCVPISIVLLCGCGIHVYDEYGRPISIF